MRSLSFALSVFSLSLASAQPPTANELAWKLEARAEAANDYQVLAATLQDNARERQVVQTFCSAPVAEPARTVRINYCTAKYKVFDARDLDLRGQAAKLKSAIEKLDQEIAALRSKGAK
jgi:hypothetical protein